MRRIINLVCGILLSSILITCGTAIGSDNRCYQPYTQKFQRGEINSKSLVDEREGLYRGFVVNYTGHALYFYITTPEGKVVWTSKILFPEKPSKQKQFRPDKDQVPPITPHVARILLKPGKYYIFVSKYCEKSKSWKKEKKLPIILDKFWLEALKGPFTLELHPEECDHGEEE